MGEKEHLDAFTHRFTVEYYSMQKKLHEGEEPLDLTINARPSSLNFDLRRDISNVKVLSVTQPTNLSEAFILANAYNNLKASSLTISESSSMSPTKILVGHAKTEHVKTIDSSDLKALKLAVSALENAGTNPRNDTPTDDKKKKKKKPTFTDPNCPPPLDKQWKNMQYCSSCKMWCKHSTEDCYRKSDSAIVNTAMKANDDDDPFSGDTHRILSLFS
jgi:hypothetical protein